MANIALDERVDHFSQSLSQVLGMTIRSFTDDGAHYLFIHGVGEEGNVNDITGDDGMGIFINIDNNGNFEDSNNLDVNHVDISNNTLQPQNVRDICQYLINQFQNQQASLGVNNFFQNTLNRLNFIRNYIAQYGTIPNQAQFPPIQPHQQGNNINNNQANVGNPKKGKGLN